MDKTLRFSLSVLALAFTASHAHADTKLINFNAVTSQQLTNHSSNGIVDNYLPNRVTAVPTITAANDPALLATETLTDDVNVNSGLALIGYKMYNPHL